MQIRHATLAILSALVLSACAATSASISNSDRAAIKAAVADFNQAVSNGDYAKAASHWAEDGVAMPPHGPTVTGRANIEKLFAGFGKTTAFREDVVEADGAGTMAYSRVSFDVTFVPPNATASMHDVGKVLLVWAKQSDGSWIVQRGAWNSDMPLPTM